MTRRRKRGVTQQSLSFLDCMSCGLGAVILLFMIINHSTQVNATDTNRDVADKVSLLESEVLEKRQTVAALQSALQETEQEIQSAKAQASSLESRLESVDTADASATQDETKKAQRRIASLADELKTLERQVASLKAQQPEESNATRDFVGQGNRQYLTGLKVGGKHILILFDTSGSMLGDSIVDVLRLRNMSPAEQRRSAKWQRALDTVDWLTTQVPADARFQIYGFNTRTTAALDGTTGSWQTGAGQLSVSIRALRQRLPANGTSLERAFMAAASLSPRPDNIYLITDGLPTQDGSASKQGLITGKQRARYYRDALKKLPGGVPVNVILFPMEGDPIAASAYWQLAQNTGGAFISPSSDWP